MSFVLNLAFHLPWLIKLDVFYWTCCKCVFYSSTRTAIINLFFINLFSNSSFYISFAIPFDFAMRIILLRLFIDLTHLNSKCYLFSILNCSSITLQLMDHNVLSILSNSSIMNSYDSLAIEPLIANLLDRILNLIDSGMAPLKNFTCDFLSLHPSYITFHVPCYVEVQEKFQIVGT